MVKRSKRTLFLGLAVVAVGAVAIGLGWSQRGGSEPDASQSVLYAVGPIPAGTTGAEAVRAGLVRPRAVAEAPEGATALTDVSQLAKTTASEDIPAGTPLDETSFRQPQTALGTVVIPEGKTALALEIQNVSGGAGYVAAGDHIDVYALADQEEGTSERAVWLAMEGLEVLRVNGSAAVENPGQPEGPGLIFLLALSPPEIERLLYLKTFHQIYFALVPRDHEPVGSTPGVRSADFAPADVLPAAVRPADAPAADVLPPE